MPRPIVQLFALLLVSCVVFMVCVAYLGVFGNDVSGRHGSAAALPAALGASADSDNNSIIINNNNNGNNLRNLRSSDEPVPSGVTVSGTTAEGELVCRNQSPSREQVRLQGDRCIPDTKNWVTLRLQ